MKKIIILLVLAAFVTCKGKSKDDKAKDGLVLVTNNDCLTCHKVDEIVTGPSFRDIANKYANAPDTIVRYLVGKIIEGGGGVWGQVPMTPHPTIPEANAEAMVAYILSLKK